MYAFQDDSHTLVSNFGQVTDMVQDNDGEGLGIKTGKRNREKKS